MSEPSAERPFKWRKARLGRMPWLMFACVCSGVDVLIRYTISASRFLEA